MDNTPRYLYPVLAVVFVVAILWAGLSRPGNRLTIGVVGPLSGSAAAYGLAQRNGVRLAVDQINAAGGINNRRLEAIFLDDGNDKVLAAEAGRDLLYKNGVVAVIGAITSDNTMNLQRLCEAARVPLLTCVSTNPYITRVNFGYSFRSLADDAVQARELARHTAQTLRLRRVAILHDNNKYGSEGARTYRREALAMGQEIAANEGYDSETTNFIPQLEKIRATNPDGLLIWGLFRESGLALRQARELGITVPAFGGDGMALPDFLSLAGTAAEGTVLTFPFDPGRGGERSRRFLEEFRKTFNTEADSFAAHGYDALGLIARAIASSDGSSQGVRDALLKIGPYEGVVGPGGLDQSGNETRAVQLAQVKNGTFVPMTIGGRP